ncbi:glycoside hydrolase family 25 protein [Paenibacillus sp.]|uniref:glycoside hydrolase family 25 protein n=1 Tax=Paenibacillus sp. TaxID=58172 RepID=UPI0028229085|nr:glycoside hydrolase family 25 protein [Paenibacillus sp.]MDR0269172.1 glycoside hydrolase family 25 protein [Paenibacillus sp.]
MHSINVQIKDLDLDRNGGVAVQSRNSNHAKGIDVSHWQGIIDWKQVKNAGYSFAFTKATEGMKLVDDRFRINAQGAKAAGLLIGAYHLTRAHKVEDVKTELEHFVQIVESAGGMNSFRLPLVLDIETKEGGSRANISAIVREWITQFKLRTGRTLMIYTFPNFMDTSLDSVFGNTPLWYAYYGIGAPADRGGWKSWEFIQCTNKGRVPGINGNVDLDEYKENEVELMAAYNGQGPSSGPNVPAWKEEGRQWLVDHVGISTDWKADDQLDMGTLGAILSKYAAAVIGMKKE